MLLLLGVLLASCGGGGGAGTGPGVGQQTDSSAKYELPEDGSLQFKWPASQVTGQTANVAAYEIDEPPAHGRAEIDRNTGIGRYVPDRDYSGTDGFIYKALTEDGVSLARHQVLLQVDPVNDPPTVAVAEHVNNSAYSYETSVPFKVSDVDSPDVRVSLSAPESDVARFRLDEASGQVIAEPLARGVARFTLQVQDEQSVTTQDVEFAVTDVDHEADLAVSSPADEAVTILNGTDGDVSFQLSHNGFPSFASLQAVADHVRRQPQAYAGEPFESKLWRFVRDSVAHDHPISQVGWSYDPLLTLNSTGWGYCSNVASLYVRIAQAAGYPARVWGLGGHVVPEVMSDGAWHLYDPDLAVFYYDRNGTVASAGELASAPDLVTEPVDPVYDMAVNPLVYSQDVASIYGSTADNAVDPVYDGPEEALDGTVTLPSGARLTYPGQWSSPPMGYDGSQWQPVSRFRQAALDLPSSFRGDFRLPWMLVGLQGSGRVRVLGVEYEVGSPELDALLQQPPQLVGEISVVEADGPLRLVFLVNVAMFAMTGHTHVVATGMDVWRLTIDTVMLPAANKLQDYMGGSDKPLSRLESVTSTAGLPALMSLVQR